MKINNNQFANELRREYISQANLAKEIYFQLPCKINYQITWQQTILAWFWDSFSRKMIDLYGNKRGEHD